MSSQVKVWRGERVLVGEEVKAATVVVQGDTIKKVLAGVVEVPGRLPHSASVKNYCWIQIVY